MDGDGDLDAVTSEQHEARRSRIRSDGGAWAGVIWYENPLIAAG